MAGLPVIASDTGANQELVREGTDGVFYAYGNTEDLAEKILLVAKEPGHYGGEATHAYALSRFSADVNAANIYKIYKEICTL